jgi:dTMP kinase
MFISLEGIEGSGKSTQMTHLRTYLADQGYNCLTTREPGGTTIGVRIREILLDPAVAHIDPLAELLLYMADRAQHLAEIVKPALKADTVVLCDRYYDATLVYQGEARGLGMEQVAQLHRLTFDDLKPDFTFLLDLPPEVGLERAWGQIESGDRTDAETRFEREKLSFHTKVRAGYLKLAKSAPERFRIVDATQSEIKVRSDIVDAFKHCLGNLNP